MATSYLNANEAEQSDCSGGASAAKAACVAGSNGVAEAMPLQSYPGTNLIRVSLMCRRYTEKRRE